MMRKPWFRIGAHVFYYMVGFSVTVGPALLYATYFGKSEEEKIELLKSKYPEDYKKNLEKRKELQRFFEKKIAFLCDIIRFNNLHMKNHEQDDQFQEVLKVGKGEMKRHYEYSPPKEKQ